MAEDVRSLTHLATLLPDADLATMLTDPHTSPLAHRILEAEAKTRAEEAAITARMLAAVSAEADAVVGGH